MAVRSQAEHGPRIEQGSQCSPSAPGRSRSLCETDNPTYDQTPPSMRSVLRSKTPNTPERRYSSTNVLLRFT